MPLPISLAGALLAWSFCGLIWIAAANQSRGAGAFATPLCGNCEQNLSRKSWLPLGGLGAGFRCPACSWSDGWARLSFEGLWGAYCLLAAWRAEDGSRFTEIVVFSAILSLILLVDLRARITYIGAMMMALAAASVVAVINGPDAVASAVIGLVIGVSVVGLFFGLSAVLFRSMRVNPIQPTDIYLAGIVGAMTRSADILQALLFSVLIATGVAVALLLARTGPRRQVLPYGPMLCLGAMAAFLY